jgi:16S rRNA C967 or C1407 C5-methylase (RsmB/RsmF family)
LSRFRVSDFPIFIFVFDVLIDSFSVTEHEKGNINRQEVVSMIPALLLDVQPQHIVLDMCAAPGSKTAQLLEAIQSSDPFSSGAVIANDVDMQRAFLLVHQTKRLGSPHFVVSTHEGQFFPTLYKRTMPPASIPVPAPSAPTEPVAAPEVNAAEARHVSCGPSMFEGSGDKAMLSYYEQGALEVQRFDRILADVPCSGDGTLRKAIDLWTKWNTQFGASLHKLQLDIARRAVQMLKVGGMMVYSTCSLNPIENEAVVAELLRRFPGVLELVDCSDKLAGLKREPGMQQWLVPSLTREETLFRSLADVDPAHRSVRLRDSFFPPSAEEASRFHLERCMRILPHKQDTGGFFISVLRKTAEIVSKPAVVAVAATSTADQIDNDIDADTEHAPADLDVTGDVPVDPQTLRGGRGPAKGGQGARKGGFPNQIKKADGDDSDDEDDIMRPITVMPPKNREFIRSFFGIKYELSDHNLFVRSDTQHKVYIVGNEVAAILRARQQNARFKLAHCGLRVFHCIFKKKEEYRICQEGLHVVLPYITKQIVYANEEDFISVIEKPQTHTSTFKDPDFIQQVQSQQLGCVIVILKRDNASASVLSSSRPVAVSAWRTPVMLNCMVTKIERQSILQLLRPDAQLDSSHDDAFQSYQQSRLKASREAAEAAVVPSE